MMTAPWDEPLSWYTSVFIYFFCTTNAHSHNPRMKNERFGKVLASETESSRCPLPAKAKNNYLNFDSEFYWILRCSHIMFGSVTNVQSFLVIISVAAALVIWLRVEETVAARLRQSRWFSAENRIASFGGCFLSFDRWRRRRRHSAQRHCHCQLARKLSSANTVSASCIVLQHNSNASHFGIVHCFAYSQLYIAVVRRHRVHK